MQISSARQTADIEVESQLRYRWWYPIIVTLLVWRHRSRSRRYLSQLDHRELADVGLTRDQQRVECAKRFWQA